MSHLRGDVHDDGEGKCRSWVEDMDQSGAKSAHEPRVTEAGLKWDLHGSMKLGLDVCCCC